MDYNKILFIRRVHSAKNVFLTNDLKSFFSNIQNLELPLQSHQEQYIYSSAHLRFIILGAVRSIGASSAFLLLILLSFLSLRRDLQLNRFLLSSVFIIIIPS
jgi:hypothetical protein